MSLLLSLWCLCTSQQPVMDIITSQRWRQFRDGFVISFAIKTTTTTELIWNHRWNENHFFFFYYDFIVKLDEHITVDDEVDRPPFIHSEAPEHYYCVLLFLYRMECISTCVDASLTLNHFIFACLVNRPTVLVTPLLLELWSHL